MKREVHTLFRAAVLLALTGGVAACFEGEVTEGDPSDSTDTPLGNRPGKYGYVVVGDSFTAGTGATAVDTENPFASAEPFTHHLGYAQQYREQLESVSQVQGLDYRNRAVFGATSREMIAGAPRLGFSQSQLAPAALFVKGHRSGATAVVSAGGNDLLLFMQSAQAQPCFVGDLPTCFANLTVTLDEFEKNLKVIVGGLRLAAGNAPLDLFVTTQVNFFHYAPCAAAGPPGIDDLGSIALEGHPQLLPRGLNTRIRAVAAAYGADVVDLFGPFYLNAEQFNAGAAAPWASFQRPDGTGDCNHPNDAGHGVILQLLGAL